jgi:signal transduction histidine kinase
MAQTDSQKLGALIKQQRSAHLAQWRRQVRELPSAKHLNIPGDTRAGCCIRRRPLADGNGLTLRGAMFRIVSGVLDRAIGTALKAYSSQRALEVRHRREEYLAFVAHDLRTPLNAIAVATLVLERQLPTHTYSGDEEQTGRHRHRANESTERCHQGIQATP